MLPARLVIFATFVGYVCGGMPDALAITTGMFLPAFAFSLIVSEKLEALADHKALHALLAGVAAGVAGLIAVTLLDLGRAGIEHSPSLLVSSIISALTLAIFSRSKSKLATPLLLALRAAVGL